MKNSNLVPREYIFSLTTPAILRLLEEYLDGKIEDNGKTSGTL